MADPGFEVESLELIVEGTTVAHLRQQIREYAATTCTGLTTTGARVHMNRPEGEEYGAAELPAVNFSTPEDVFSGSAEKVKHQRQAKLMASIRARGVDCVDVADQAAAEIEAALMADPTFGGLVKDAWNAETQSSSSGNGDQRVAAVEVEFRVDYRISMLDPETAIQ